MRLVKEHSLLCIIHETSIPLLQYGTQHCHCYSSSYSSSSGRGSKFVCNALVSQQGLCRGFNMWHYGWDSPSSRCTAVGSCAGSRTAAFLSS